MRSISAISTRLMIEVDGTPNKGRLGANAILGVSLAVARAAAEWSGLPLYRYLGGSERVHVAGADDEHPQRRQACAGLQRRHAGVHGHARWRGIVPRRAANGRRSLPRAARTSCTIAGSEPAWATKGGFAPSLESNEAAIKVVTEAITKAGYRPGEDLVIALDPATTELYHDGKYELKGERRTLTSEEMVNYWTDWTKRYPIKSIEDGLSEDDWDGWKALTERIGSKVQLVGDDLFVTNTERLQSRHSRTRGQLDPGQAQSDRHADRNLRHDRDGASGRVHRGHSHRSGETDDTFIADLAVATNSGQIKTGAPSRIDRVAKYNQLLRIEEALGDAAVYPGDQIFSRFR